MAVFRLVGLSKNKRTGIWEYRRVPPAHFRSYFEKREFKRSTGTADKAEAERRVLPFIAQWKAIEESLEATHRAAVKGVVHGAGEPQLTAPSELPEETMRTLAGEAGRSLLAKHSANPAPRPEAFNRNDSIPPTSPHGEPAPWGTATDPWAGRRFMLLAPKKSGVPASAQGEVTNAARAVLVAHGLSAEGPQWETLCYLVREALDGAYAVLQRRHRGEAWTDAIFAERFPGGKPSGAPRVSIKGLIEHWKAGKERPDQKTYDRYGRALAEFASFVGHDDANRIEPGDLQRWLISLSQKKLSAKTINEGYRAGVKACFSAGLEAGVLRIDPLASVKFRIKADPTKVASRHPYSDADAEKLLTAARGRRDALRWLPMLMAYSGARIGEVSQLRREDVRYATAEEAKQGGTSPGMTAHPKRRGGVYYLRLTNEGEGQRLKNAASRRDVPLHSDVIARAFLEWVEAVPAGQYLFPDLTPGKYGHKGDGGSRDYRKWARGEVGITDKRLTAHSWRHRFEDQLRMVGAPEDVRDAITGHARKSTGASYGHGHSLTTKAKWIDAVPAIRSDPRGGKRSPAKGGEFPNRVNGGRSRAVRDR